MSRLSLAEFYWTLEIQARRNFYLILQGQFLRVRYAVNSLRVPNLVNTSELETASIVSWGTASGCTISFVSLVWPHQNFNEVKFIFLHSQRSKFIRSVFLIIFYLPIFFFNRKKDVGLAIWVNKCKFNKL